MSIFSRVPAPKVPHSTHDNSHVFQTTFNIGGIYPILTELVTPGEKWKCNIASFLRTMPLVSPVLGEMDLKIDAFSVPLRLIWDDFEDFISKGPSGQYIGQTPKLKISGVQLNSGTYPGVPVLYDHLGFGNLPGNVGTSYTINALPYRAYQRIYNDYFRNQNYQDEIPIHTASSALTVLTANAGLASDLPNFAIKNRNWNRDYFTSILPNPQKGPGVAIPFSQPEIVSDDKLVFKAKGIVSGDTPKPFETAFTEGKTDETFTIKTETSAGSFKDAMYESGLKLESSFTPTIEQLRYAETLQEYCEAMARGGERYTEYLQTIWNVRSRDSRLQRAEYLGGYRSPISISEVMQQAPATDSPLGTLAGKGVSAGSSKLFRHFFDEWSIVMVTMSVVPRSMYGQGRRRWLMYDDPTEYPNPFFGNLGEQETYKGELYMQHSSDDKTVIGYLPRMAEAKTIPSTFHGQFKSSLNYWTVGRQFANAPSINSNFITVLPAEEAKLFPNTVSTFDQFVGEFHFGVKRKNRLPYFGIPRITHM